ncbi:unnamed protein product [Moneuplotes crassus]|uniref:C2H2-type domain-containing protein n=1 Tax=Euplotes crassus TaxID=5936 RepID=A0AAD1XEW3_EUPCR|nr:unnamed protein product [Moneuplotes crassus]
MINQIEPDLTGLGQVVAWVVEMHVTEIDEEPTEPLFAVNQNYPQQVVMDQVYPSIMDQFCLCQEPNVEKENTSLPSLNDINLLLNNSTDRDQVFNHADSLNLPEEPLKKLNQDKLVSFPKQFLRSDKPSESEGIVHDKEDNPMYSVRKLKKVIQKTQAQYHYTCLMGTCKRKFNKFDDLKTHLVLHNKFKPFKCPNCPKRYTQKGNMTKHMRSHFTPNIENRRRFVCEFCHKGYTEKYNLKTHQKKFHLRE